MGWVSTSQIGERSGSFTAGEFTYTKKYRVVFDSWTASSISAASAPGIPRTFETFSDGGDLDVFAVVTAIRADQSTELAPYAWDVEVDFRRAGDQEKEQNPLLRAARLYWSFGVGNKIAEKDINGDAIVNSSEEQFDPPAEMDDPVVTLRVEKNYSSFDPATAYDYVNTVNDDVFLGATARKWKCNGISQNGPEEENGIVHYPVEFEFAFNPNTWDLEVLDRGFKKIVAGEQINITDGNDQLITSPKLLDGAGGELAVGGAPVFLTFEVYQKKVFAALGIF